MFEGEEGGRSRGGKEEAGEKGRERQGGKGGERIPGKRGEGTRREW